MGAGAGAAVRELDHNNEQGGRILCCQNKTAASTNWVGSIRYHLGLSARSNFTAYPHDKAASEGSVTGDEVSLRERKRLESRCEAGGMKGGQMTMVDADWN